MKNMESIINNPELIWLNLLKIDCCILSKQQIDAVMLATPNNNHSISIIFSQLAESEHFNANNISSGLSKLPLNYWHPEEVANSLKDIKSLNSTHLMLLIDKAHPDTMPKLAKHIPYERLPNLEMGHIIEKMMSKCPEDKRIEINRNIRNTLIKVFGLHILKISDNISEVVDKSIPTLQHRIMAEQGEEALTP